MNIFRVQLLGLAQDESVVHMLRYQGAPFISTQGQIGVKVRRGGRIQRLRAANTDELLKKLRLERLNELHVTSHEITPFHVPGIGTVRMASMILEISPHNVLWLPASAQVASNRNGERARASFTSIEESLAFHGVKNCPTLFEVVVFFEAEPAYAPKEIITRLIAELSKFDPTTQYVGLVDLAKEGSPLVGLNVLHRLAPSPRQYDCLGEQFDDLHHAFIVPIEMAERLMLILGQHATLSPELQGGMAAVILTPDAMIDPDIRHRLRDFLVQE